MITGQVGLAAAILVGIGEFLLHYDKLARYTDTFAFFEGVTRERATIGHFFGVFGAPLYVCLLYTSPSPRDKRQSRMPSSA